MAEGEATRLSVNLNKVALLRNQRDIGYPDVVEMARIVVAAGADGITVHPRPDQRHVRTGDVLALKRLIAEDLHHRVEFNVEGYPGDDFLELIEEVRPDQVTLVPDAPDQATSDHGWDVAVEKARLRRIVERLRAAGSRVSLFMDPEPGAMAGAAATGAERIELYTGPYAFAFGAGEGEGLLERYVRAAGAADAAGLGINAGHDLNLDNLPPFRRAIPKLAEVSIGHAITADALKIGFPAAVEAYLRALGRAPFAS
ncbi:MAG TPA: pyridoxine 5'-phosphate synthase [Geminicoccaceae bacterium]